MTISVPGILFVYNPLDDDLEQLTSIPVLA